MHQLRYVVAVARAGNFSRAADQCHVSQPSLSQQIQKLEEELGEKLFDRLKRQARLTPAGEALLHRAVRILEEVDSAQRDARDRRKQLRGPLVLGVLPTIAPFLLPRAVAAFSRSTPAVEIIIQEETTAQLLKLLAECELDLAIASLPVRDHRFEIEKLFDEQLLLALPPAHPLASRRRVRLADLENERFILMKEGHCLSDQV